MIVFMLWHMRPLGPDETDDVGETNDKMCGVFTTRERAEAARQQLTAVEGFRDYPDDFLIDEHTLDEVLWEDGFVNVRPSDELEDEVSCLLCGHDVQVHPRPGDSAEKACSACVLEASHSERIEIDICRLELNDGLTDTT